MSQNIDSFALEIRYFLAKITGKPYKFIAQKATKTRFIIAFRAQKENPTFDAILDQDEDFTKEIKVCKIRFLKYLQEIRPDSLTEKYRN